MVHVVARRGPKDSSHSRPKAIAARSTVASSAAAGDGERHLRDRETPVELGSLKALLASLDTPDSDVCAAALAPIRAHLPSDDPADLLQLSTTELRQLLASCDLRPVSRTIIFGRISTAGSSGFASLSDARSGSVQPPESSQAQAAVADCTAFAKPSRALTARVASARVASFSFRQWRVRGLPSPSRRRGRPARARSASRAAPQRAGGCSACYGSSRPSRESYWRLRTSAVAPGLGRPSSRPSSRRRDCSSSPTLRYPTGGAILIGAGAWTCWALRAETPGSSARWVKL